jgi:Rrf2 family protein
MIRRHSDYGVRALLYLATANRPAVPCAELASACAIPKSFAYKVLRKLRAGGLVDGRQGRPGGFNLCGNPAAISLLDVVEVMQGSVTVSRCVMECSVCQNAAACPLSVKWKELQDRIVHFLKQITLQDLLAILTRQGGGAASEPGS